MCLPSAAFGASAATGAGAVSGVGAVPGVGAAGSVAGAGAAGVASVGLDGVGSVGGAEPPSAFFSFFFLMKRPLKAFFTWLSASGAIGERSQQAITSWTHVKKGYVNAAAGM